MKKKLIIGIMAEAQSGKDTAGKILTNHATFVALQPQKIAFATKIKQIAGELFELTEEQLSGADKDKPTKYRCKICPSCGSVDVVDLMLDGYPNAQCNGCKVIGDVTVFNKYWTPRMIYQFIGGECFRKIWSDVWVNHTMKAVDAALNEGTQLVIVTDVRHKNEADAIWARGGEVWRINREGRTAPQGLPRHGSEEEQKTIPDALLQAVIDNNGSEEHLRAQLISNFNRYWSK